jgi:hypothetical protein
MVLVVLVLVLALALGGAGFAYTPFGTSPRSYSSFGCLVFLIRPAASGGGRDRWYRW